MDFEPNFEFYNEEIFFIGCNENGKIAYVNYIDLVQPGNRTLSVIIKDLFNESSDTLLSIFNDNEDQFYLGVDTLNNRIINGFIINEIKKNGIVPNYSIGKYYSKNITSNLQIEIKVEGPSIGEVVVDSIQTSNLIVVYNGEKTIIKNFEVDTFSAYDDSKFNIENEFGIAGYFLSPNKNFIVLCVYEAFDIHFEREIHYSIDFYGFKI